MPQVEAGRREARKASTRDALLRAGRSLFAVEAVDAVSIDAVVAAAGVSKGSFYNHFPDRNALADCVAGDIRAELHAEVERANAGEADAARRMARAVCVFFRYAATDPEGAAALARIHGANIATASPHNAPLVGDIHDGLTDGRFHIPTLDSGVVLVIGVVQAGMLSILQEPGTALAVAKAQQLGMLILRALGVEAQEAERIAAQSAEQIVRSGLPDATQT
jgi:AcrR family transcriptional regulator